MFTIKVECSIAPTYKMIGFGALACSMWEQHKKDFAASASTMCEQHKKDFGQVCNLKRDEVPTQTFKRLKKMWYLHTKQKIIPTYSGDT
ncbi:MAG: hypothetical protein ACRCZI_12600, partial [Cetobacterium sp.]